MPDGLLGYAFIGLIFGALASACAFVISYGSYHNQFMDTRTPMRLALHTAGVTFVFFFVACTLLPWVFGMLRHIGG